MKHLLLLPLALLAAPRADESLTFDVEAGSSLTKTFTSELSLDLERLEMKLTVGDEEHELEAPELEMHILESESLEFTDEYLAVEDGRATRVKRKFDALSETSGRSSTNPDGVSDENEEVGESELQGHTVVLTADEDGDWSAAFAEGDEDGDEGLLEELEHRADLVEFLPGEPVAVGDTWEVPLVAFHHISNPCGDVHLMTPTEREEGDDDDAMQDALRESLDGEIHATLERIEDGVAHIALTMELTMEGEVQGEDQETEEGVTLETFRSLEIELDLEGELQWVMESGRASNLVVAGEVALKQSQAQAGDHGGAVFRFEQIQHLTGTFEIKAAIE